ncbi:MAG: hypothetical protein IH820_16845 [Bacteroidetes bacterium]|nr:hypothetical protein [Bacteroidota bacterium]
MLKKTQIARLTPALSLCLFVLAGCAPAGQVAEPGGRVGPVDEAAVLGVWTYEVTGSCFLLRGDLYITRGQSGLSGRLTEKPFPANVGPDPFETQKDQRRCPQRAIPATITLTEITFDGRTLVFSGSSSDQMTAPFSLQGRATVNDGRMRGTLAINGSLGNVGRSEAARLKATRARGGSGQPYKAGTTMP